jgi:hypothetical protein
VKSPQVTGIRLESSQLLRGMHRASESWDRKIECCMYLHAPMFLFTDRILKSENALVLQQRTYFEGCN